MSKPYPDVKVGDELLVDGGMARFEVIEKLGPDVKCHCTDPGLVLPRANLTIWRDGGVVRERNAMLPTISSKVISIVNQLYANLYRSSCGRNQHMPSCKFKTFCVDHVDWLITFPEYSN
jgi:hypothetical protein